MRSLRSTHVNRSSPNTVSHHIYSYKVQFKLLASAPLSKERRAVKTAAENERRCWTAWTIERQVLVHEWEIMSRTIGRMQAQCGERRMHHFLCLRARFKLTLCRLSQRIQKLVKYRQDEYFATNPYIYFLWSQ